VVLKQNNPDQNTIPKTTKEEGFDVFGKFLLIKKLA
jgi:hypothetical protein